MDVEDVIGDALFEEKHESMICVRDIEIYSMCEHHMLPFFGKAQRRVPAERQDRRAVQDPAGRRGLRSAGSRLQSGSPIRSPKRCAGC